jgi:hypothetical protein
MRLQTAVEFVEEQRHAGTALVPVNQVTALMEAMSQALSRRDQSIEVASGSNRLQVRSDIYARLRRSYRGPKITSGSLLAVSSALFVFMGSLEKHPILGVYLQNWLFVRTLLYAWITSGILFLWFWYREGLAETQAEFLLSDEALSEVFPLLCHYAAHRSEKKGAFRIDQLAYINARWWRSGRSRYSYYRVGALRLPLVSALRRLVRLLKGDAVDITVAQKVARDQVAKLADRRAIKKIEDPDVAEWYQIDQILLGACRIIRPAGFPPDRVGLRSRNREEGLLAPAGCGGGGRSREPEGPPGQATCGDQPLRNSFRRLWVAQIRIHSACTASNPRSRKRRRPRTSLIWPNTGSTVSLRLEYSRLPFFVRSLRAIRSRTVARLGMRPRGTDSAVPCFCRPVAT